jgi:hypothetical protein
MQEIGIGGIRHVMEAPAAVGSYKNPQPFEQYYHPFEIP